MSDDDDPGDELRTLAENLVGPAEIGRLLNVNSNTINIWKTRHPDFPRPIRRLKSSDLWDVREIRAWAKSTNRFPADESGEHQSRP